MYVFFRSDDGAGLSTIPVNMKDLRFPPQLPQGCAIFSLKWFRLVMNPLPSLSVTYEVRFIFNDTACE